MTPSWYDVLGVEPDAAHDEILETWRTAVAELAPTDRRFRSLNQAAEVLLDEDRRAEHDRELAVQAELDAEAAEPVAAAPETASMTGETDQLGPAEPTSTLAPSPPAVATPASRNKILATAALGVAAVVLLVAAVISVVSGGDAAPDSADGLPDARDVAAARGAAEAAAVPVLSYDYRTLEQDKQEALSYLTPDYAVEYEQLFASAIELNAPATQTVVTANVLTSAIVRTGEDLVDVLLFVNRPTTNIQDTTPVIYKDQATLRMRDIDGEWLVACIITAPGSPCEG